MPADSAAPNPDDLTETTLDTHEVYDGALLHVFRDTVETPSGGTSVREWIRHPGAAAVVPLFDNGDTLLVRQFRYPPRRTFLEVPAGKLDRSGLEGACEDPAVAARRELAEETGLTAETLTPLGPLYPCIGYSDEVIHFFLAEGLTEGKTNLGEGEHAIPVRMPFADAVAQARRGEIADMKTAMGLVLADAHLAARRA